MKREFWPAAHFPIFVGDTCPHGFAEGDDVVFGHQTAEGTTTVVDEAFCHRGLSYDTESNNRRVA